MKKKTAGIVAVILTIISAVALIACSGINIGGAVNYYGCPNSKRVNRLNTRKWIKL